MSQKFGKYREVDYRYLNIPVKYCLNHTGANEGSKDKTLCIVDFYGKDKALVAWRNNNTYKMGMTKMCKVIWKKDKMYLRYKGKLIQLSGTGGWVL